MYPIDVNAMKQLENAISEEGCSLGELMNRAGQAVARKVRHYAPNPVPVAVLCGAGNNGGDGWAAARDLAWAGYPVAVVTPIAPESLEAQPAKDVALQVMRLLVEADGSQQTERPNADDPDDVAASQPLPLRVIVAPDDEQLSHILGTAEVAVDAMLGIGFNGLAVREPLASWIGALNAAHLAGLAVVAADVPSGLSAETGNPADPTVVADSTVTMLGVKPGLLEKLAKPFVGKLEVDYLGWENFTKKWMELHD